MSNTLLGLGIVALVAAIVGGSLKAFGFEFPAIQSARRQLALAILGVVLIVVAEWNEIESIIFPPKYLTETTEPLTLETGKAYNIPIVMGRSGVVDLVLVSLDSNWTDFKGPRNVAGQDSVHVTICSARLSAPCPSRQISVGQGFSQELPAGSGSISIFNFATNPPVRFTVRVKRPA